MVYLGNLKSWDHTFGVILLVKVVLAYIQAQQHLRFSWPEIVRTHAHWRLNIEGFLKVLSDEHRFHIAFACYLMPLELCYSFTLHVPRKVNENYNTTVLKPWPFQLPHNIRVVKPLNNCQHSL